MCTCVTWLMHMCDVTHPVVWHDSFICFMRCPTSITRFACVLCKCMCSLFWPTYTYDMNMCDWDIKFCFCTHHSVSESQLASLSCWLSTHRSVAHSQLHLFYPSCLFCASCVCVCLSIVCVCMCLLVCLCVAATVFRVVYMYVSMSWRILHNLYAGTQSVSVRISL